MKLPNILTFTLMLVLVHLPIEPLSAQYQIRGWVIGAGVGEAGNHELNMTFTTGEPVTGSMKSDTQTLYSGFQYLADTKIYVTSADQPESDLPDRFALDQNYPNPFNPTTRIRYSVAEPTDIRLTVYNALGQRVATLVDENKSSGKHEVTFDATGLSSGIYLYRLQTDGFKETRKMLLVK